MSRFEISIFINRPPEEVFAFVNDLDTWLRWQSGLLEVKKTSPDPLAAGSTYTVVGQFRDQPMEAHYTVSEFEANKRTVVRSPGNFTIESQTVFEEVDGGTQLVQRTEISAGSKYESLTPMVISWNKDHVEKSFASLKALMEAPAS